MAQEPIAIEKSESTHRASTGELGYEVSRLAMTSLAMAAGLIGAWTLARIGVALVVSGGPIALLRAWFSAVTGTGM